jgi:hypothetical protein
MKRRLRRKIRKERRRTTVNRPTNRGNFGKASHKVRFLTLSIGPQTQAQSHSPIAIHTHKAQIIKAQSELGFPKNPKPN